MKITYIHHSSFFVELEEVTLLFDYYSGSLQELPNDKPLFVFSSHFHGDHYAPVIFKLSENRDNVFYILSKDIKKKDVPPKLSGRVRFVEAGERFIPEYNDMQNSEFSQKFSTMTVETFKSTDEGVAFWISCEGREIYHAGDLNNWWWEGEDKAWNHNMAANYKKEIDKMAGRKADIAFVPVDPRQGEQFYLGLDGLMKKVSAKTIFPMHFWKDYQIIEKIKNHPCSESYRDAIIEIHKEGEEFTL